MGAAAEIPARVEFHEADWPSAVYVAAFELLVILKVLLASGVATNRSAVFKKGKSLMSENMEAF